MAFRPNPVPRLSMAVPKAPAPMKAPMLKPTAVPSGVGRVMPMRAPTNEFTKTRSIFPGTMVRDMATEYTGKK